MPNISFSDPGGDKIVTIEDAIQSMKDSALMNGGCYLNDRYALDDFFALHWAVETTRPITHHYDKDDGKWTTKKQSL
ncbi:hypothetical protein [Ferrimonas balearica]|uniref:hypothetical protein n=1 Tax=Ferrimonas balearica TaxID=44012 RepID=UPI001F40D810|nr:hypothetical protein [Ferrimonas balearica]MBY6093830.1 hypothetical protein [Ferrimonas balearica]